MSDRSDSQNLKRGLRLPAWLKFGVGGIIVVASFYFLIGRLVRDWDQIRFTQLHLSPGRLAAAFAVLLLAHFPLYGWVWSSILRALGARISVAKSTAITAVSAIGKYAPGKVWFTLGRMTLARNECVSEGKTLLSVLLEISFFLFAGIILLGIGILFLPRSQVPAPVYLLFVLAPACLAVMYPPVLNRLLRIPLKWLKRPPLELHIHYGTLLGILGICLLDWLAQGVGCFILISSFCPLPIAKLPIMLGGYAVSWMIGFLVLVSPAGLGVREGIFTLVLKGFLPEPIAIISAIVTRIWMALGELTAALVGFVFLRASSRRKNG